MARTSSAARHREERRSLAPRICSPRDAASGRGRTETPLRGPRGGGVDEPSHGEELTPKLAMRLGTAWLDPPERPPERVCARARPDPGNSWRIPKARGRANVGARVSAAAAAAGQSGSETSEGPETRTLRPSTALGARVQTRRSRRLPRWENRFVHSGPWGRRTDAAFLFEPFCQPGV